MRTQNINKVCDKAMIAFLKGDKGALGVIYDCMAKLIYSTAYGITGSVQDAEDVLQNTMIEISKYAHTYKAGSNPKAWMLTIAHHCSIDVIRKRKPDIPIEDSKLPETSGTQPDFSQIEVLELLSLLDPEERRILIYRLYTGLPYKQIASVMGISVTSAQKKYQRSVKKLKACYQNEEVSHEKT